MPPKGTEIADSLALAEDIFIEVSHGPTLIDNNLLLSNCACRISTQGIALVHNLIAGSFIWVGNGTDNGGIKFPSPRYTPYHVPHRTEVAGFMTILHGDARFYNNIFVQQEIRQDLIDAAKSFDNSAMDMVQFICGTKPYDGYPTASAYFSKFTAESTVEYEKKDMFYDHLPVYTGGNVYFNGAQPCDTEENYQIVNAPAIKLELKEENNNWKLLTNLFDYLPEFETPFISTEMLGEAFEPEQKFESPDGTPITFNQDYFGQHRSIRPLSGPFADKQEDVFLL